jgi:uridine phosphorylase
VGTCGALDASLSLGQLIVASEALAADGTSRALGAADRVSAHPELVARLAGAADAEARTGPVVSSDLFYDGAPGAEEAWRASGALAVEMETAALFALAQRRGLRAGCVLIVSDIVLPARRRIAAEALCEAEHRLGQVALAALTG